MTDPGDKSPCLYTIPPGAAFADSLARGILDRAGDDPLALARFQILLPTRRACRSLRDAFLKISGGKPLLLPRLHPIGDVDEEELSLLLSGMEDELSLPPALPALRRQFLLTRMIAAKEQYSRGLEQDMMLASALGRLMDQVYTEDLDFADLPNIVGDDFADHWQISLRFLSILSETWPAILAEQGMMDEADRRNKLIKRLAQHWEDHPPAHPVIAAGSTGSIPSTLALLRAVSHMEQGCVVLPGLDQTMDDDSWRTLDDTHPQATLRNLLQEIGVDRKEVVLWPAIHENPQHKIAMLASEIMRPAETAAAWQNLRQNPVVTADDLKIERYDCATPQEEALIIALALRQALEAPDNKASTAAVVTPDRKLARRVAMACRRWGIEIDDTAGTPLSQTPIGIYLRMGINTAIDGLRPVSLLSFAKHSFCQPDLCDDWRSKIRDLDRTLLRGLYTGKGLAAYRGKAKIRAEKGRPVPSHTDETLNFIAQGFKPFTDLGPGPHPIAQWCEAHLLCAEYFSRVNLLWAGPAGEKAALLLSDLQDQAAASGFPMVTMSQYAAIVEQLMDGVAVRPAYGLHPRLMILGQLEARLVQADLMILAGLNENTWPPDPGNDPWMSRPMRKRFGLPPLERGIGLAAHDFAQAFCAPRLILTRSVRVDGTPTVPARWLQRLDTVLKASQIDPALLQMGKLMSYARALNHTVEQRAFKRPEPRPPVSVRPRKLPVTQIERWMQDPYSIYARYILNLRKLDPLEQKLDAAARGTLLHAILDRFVTDHPDDIPKHASARFLAITQDELAKIEPDPAMLSLWNPRFVKIGDWLISHETMWRTIYKPAAREVEGQYCLNVGGQEFVMTARADRIDLSRDGTAAAIIDYKSGGQYSGTRMQNGLLPQLPLEALILEAGGFASIKSVAVANLSYWILRGSKEGGEVKSLEDPHKLSIAIDNARAGLEALIEKFDDETTPYYSLPRPQNAPLYNDYEHLARVKEWTALDEQGANDA